MNTFFLENSLSPPFFRKLPLSIERGEGLYVWDEEGRRYLDFTSGWGVTALGHAHPVLLEALLKQAHKIWQTPNASLVCNPTRARLLDLMTQVLPRGLKRTFFCTSGSEANDAAIKLARKITGRPFVVSAREGFHGRMISTSPTPAQIHRTVNYGDEKEIEAAIDKQVAAVILEPILGEGGVIVPPPSYLLMVSDLCLQHGALFIIDEVQTGFCRTGPFFVSSELDTKMDFLTMGKGIAGGFPFAAFAITEEIAEKLSPGDHGGTYAGNPLGCAVAEAVIHYLLEQDIPSHVEEMGFILFSRLRAIQKRYPFAIKDVRGRGLLAAIEMSRPEIAAAVFNSSLKKGLILNFIQNKIIRVFPALIVNQNELEEGMALFEEALIESAVDTCD